MLINNIRNQRSAGSEETMTATTWAAFSEPPVTVPDYEVPFPLVDLVYK